MRIRDWRIVFLFLVLISAVELSLAATNKTSPMFNYDDPKLNREFQNVYQTAARSPAIFIGSGAPAFTPQKMGDTFIDTTTTHVYAATATLTSKSWLQVK